MMIMCQRGKKKSTKDYGDPLVLSACKNQAVALKIYFMTDTLKLQRNKMPKSTRVRGFTLVEILIVLALIGIVAGLAMSNLGEIFGGGKVKAAQTWVNSTGEAYVNSYLAMVGDYPKSLSELRTPPKGVPPFVKRASDLQDPWGKDYVYQYPGSRNTGSFDLSTTAPDGTVLGNWDSATGN
jgi:general secretion pathway protein G